MIHNRAIKSRSYSNSRDRKSMHLLKVKARSLLPIACKHMERFRDDAAKRCYR